MSYLLEYLPPQRRNKAVANTGHIHQLFALVVAHDDGIESARSGDIAADNKLLRTIDSVLYPRSASLARLVQAVLALGDHALKLLFSHPCKHGPGRHIELLGDTDPL